MFLALILNFHCSPDETVVIWWLVVLKSSTIGVAGLLYKVVSKTAYEIEDA